MPRISYTKGWSRPQASRCRAAHYVDPDDNTLALCGAVLRTHQATKQHPREVCDHCQTAARRRKR